MTYLYDGRDLIDKRENQALLEIIGRLSQFGGLTMTAIIGNPVYDGLWKSPKTGIVAKDKNSMFTVLLPQAPENIQFFMRKKDKWRKFLNYEELLITVHEIQVI